MVLTVENVHKSFASAEGATPVLRGVDLAVGAGETVALTGESGSGKSTLLHLIGGLDAFDAGQITVAGVPLQTLDDTGRAALRRGTVGIVFQQFNLVPSLTVAANVAMQARLARKDDPDLYTRLMDALGLQAHAYRYPEALSGGQQQRVAIARALAARPQLVLADEPTGNLDEATASHVLDEMLALVSDTGASLLVVTHSQTVSARMDRRVHLRRGSIA